MDDMIAAINENGTATLIIVLGVILFLLLRSRN